MNILFKQISENVKKQTNCINHLQKRYTHTTDLCTCILETSWIDFFFIGVECHKLIHSIKWVVDDKLSILTVHILQIQLKASKYENMQKLLSVFLL